MLTCYPDRLTDIYMDRCNVMSPLLHRNAMGDNKNPVFAMIKTRLLYKTL